MSDTISSINLSTLSQGEQHVAGTALSLLAQNFLGLDVLASFPGSSFTNTSSLNVLNVSTPGTIVADASTLGLAPSAVVLTNDPVTGPTNVDLTVGAGTYLVVGNSGNDTITATGLLPGTIVLGEGQNVVNADGGSLTLEYGNAQVNVTSLTGLTVASGNDTVSFDPGVLSLVNVDGGDVTLTGMTYVQVASGNETVNAGTTGSLILLGNLSADTVHANLTVTGSAVVDANGGINTITLATDQEVVVGGGQNTIVYTSGAGSEVLLNAGAATVSGADNILASGGTLSASGITGTVFLEGAGSNVTFTSAGESVLALAGNNSITFTTDTLGGNPVASATVVEGGNNTVTGGFSDVVYLEAASTLTTNGASALLLAGSSGSSVTANGGSLVALLGGNNDTITTGSGNDSVAIDGSDSVTVNASNETGNLFVVALSGNDTISTGSGKDTISIEGSTGVTVNGGSGDLFVAAVTGNDSITTSAGNDSIAIQGSNGVTVNGGASAGKLFVAAVTGNDSITTGSGNDSIAIEGSNSVTVNGGASSGNLFVVAFTGNDSIIAGSGNDSILSLGANATIHGGSGNLFVDAISGNDSVAAGSGGGTLFSGSGNDTFVGGTSITNATYMVALTGGSDTFVGGSGIDAMADLGANSVVFKFESGVGGLHGISAQTVSTGGVSTLAATDKLDLSSYSLTDISNALSSQTTVAGGTSLHLSDNTTIILYGVDTVTNSNLV